MITATRKHPLKTMGAFFLKIPLLFYAYCNVLSTISMFAISDDIIKQGLLVLSSFITLALTGLRYWRERFNDRELRKAKEKTDALEHALQEMEINYTALQKRSASFEIGREDFRSEVRDRMDVVEAKVDSQEPK